MACFDAECVPGLILVSDGVNGFSVSDYLRRVTAYPVGKLEESVCLRVAYPYDSTDLQVSGCDSFFSLERLLDQTS